MAATDRAAGALSVATCSAEAIEAAKAAWLESGGAIDEDEEDEEDEERGGAEHDIVTEQAQSADTAKEDAVWRSIFGRGNTSVTGNQGSDR